MNDGRALASQEIGFAKLQRSPPSRYVMAVDAGLTHPASPYLFGGAALSAGVDALEDISNRKAGWASAQFVTSPPLGETVHLEATILASGRSASQGHCVAHFGDREAFRVAVALSDRIDTSPRPWVTAPDVPPPDACPHFLAWGRDDGEPIQRRVDCRVGGRGGLIGESDLRPGEVRLWLRSLERRQIDRSMLSVFSDFAPACIEEALGAPWLKSSMDITIRFCAPPDSEWILGQIFMDAVHGGFAHIRGNFFCESGALVAITSQTMVLRGKKTRVSNPTPMWRARREERGRSATWAIP